MESKMMEIRILILEDDPLDAELAIANLETEGYRCRWRSVDSRDDFIHELDTGSWDIVLSDYKLPDFDGLSALELFLERNMNIPFILVSGYIGEEAAIQILKAGATDYVLKNRLQRLGPAVKRALEEIAEKRRRREAEKRMKAALEEKTVLLQELYHRTNNNMQVISAMLLLRAAHTKDERIIGIAREIGSKIEGMALVHRKLYKSKHLSRIDMQEYLTELTQMLLRTYPGLSDGIRMELAVEPLGMLIDTAIPCGLVVNELVSNALKHAFTDGRQGKIRLVLKKTGQGEIELSISDNRVGIPADFDRIKNESFGIGNAIQLVEYQMQGKIWFETGKGLTCIARFKDNLYQERV